MTEDTRIMLESDLRNGTADRYGDTVAGHEAGIRAAAETLLSLAAHAPAHAGQDVLVSPDVVGAALRRMDKPFVLGVLGEFRAGKSTLINALTGLPLALTDVIETTSTLNEYCYGSETLARVVYKDMEEEQMSLDAVKSLLGERRRQTDWLQRIDHVTVSAPSDFLARFSIWDAPGLGGSGHNEILAMSFMERIDAAIWVFDVDFLGAGRLQMALDDLGRRGKAVVALLNKADGKDPDEIAEATEYLSRAHDGIAFQRIVPFSALRATAPRGATGSDDVVGPDGGLAALRSYLLDDLLREPRMLTVQAVAGDLSAAAYSLQQIFEEEASSRRRRLWLFEQQSGTIGRTARSTAEDLAAKVCDGLEQRLPEAVTEKVEEATLRASEDELASTSWRDQMFRGVVTNELLASIIREYLEECRPMITGDWHRAAEDVCREFGGAMTPEELSIWSPTEAISGLRIDFKTDGLLPPVAPMDASSTPNSHEQSDGRGSLVTASVVGTGVTSVLTAIAAARDALATGSTVFGAIQAFGTGALAGATVAGTLAAVFAPLAATLAAGPIIRKIVTTVTAEFQRRPEMTPELMRDELINRSAEAVRDWATREVMPKARDEVVVPFFQGARVRFEEAFTNDTRRRIFGEASKEEVAREEAHFTARAADARTVTTALFSLSGADVDSVKSHNLMDGPMTFTTANRAGLERLLERIFSGTASRIEITDRSFASENFPLLKQSRAATPIQILTYDQPRSAAVRDDFTTALTHLRTRTGSVRVRVPFVGIEQSCPLPDTGSWIFTDAGAFSLSHSFAAIGSADITVTPHDDDGRLREEHFAKWWDEKLPGVQAPDIR